MKEPVYFSLHGTQLNNANLRKNKKNSFCIRKCFWTWFRLKENLKVNPSSNQQIFWENIRLKKERNCTYSFIILWISLIDSGLCSAEMEDLMNLSRISQISISIIEDASIRFFPCFCFCLFIRKEPFFAWEWDHKKVKQVSNIFSKVSMLPWGITFSVVLYFAIREPFFFVSDGPVKEVSQFCVFNYILAILLPH